MFEYVNTGFVIVGTILSAMFFLLAILISGKAHEENRKTIVPYFLIAAIGLVIAFVIGESINTKNRVEQNIVQFQKGSELNCATFGTLYLVSKQEGWRLYKNSFLKDSILLDARYCEK